MADRFQLGLAAGRHATVGGKSAAQEHGLENLRQGSPAALGSDPKAGPPAVLEWFPLDLENIYISAKPMIRIIDIEPTGIDPATDAIIEIASVDMVRGGGITNGAPDQGHPA